MIDVYTWPTPNGHKVHIMLEETGLPYRVHAVDIGAGEQFKPEFLKISPNNKIPAIVDSDAPPDEKSGKPISMFESGAILVYLAAKTGRLLPAKLRDRWSTLQWLMFQMGSIGPMLGQAHHFRAYAPEKIQYAMDRYLNEANRLYGVLDRRLAESRYVACGEYTIADIAIMPWLRSYKKQGVEIGQYANVKRWFDAINERPAVMRGLAVLADVHRPPPDDPKWRENLFGATQYRRR
jgi:GST-like protein